MVVTLKWCRVSKNVSGPNMTGGNYRPANNSSNNNNSSNSSNSSNSNSNCSNNSNNSNSNTINNGTPLTSLPSVFLETRQPWEIAIERMSAQMEKMMNLQHSF